MLTISTTFSSISPIITIMKIYTVIASIARSVQTPIILLSNIIYPNRSDAYLHVTIRTFNFIPRPPPEALNNNHFGVSSIIRRPCLNGCKIRCESCCDNHVDVRKGRCHIQFGCRCCTFLKIPSCPLLLHSIRFLMMHHFISHLTKRKDSILSKKE